MIKPVIHVNTQGVQIMQAPAQTVRSAVQTPTQQQQPVRTITYNAIKTETRELASAKEQAQKILEIINSNSNSRSQTPVKTPSLARLNVAQSTNAPHERIRQFISANASNLSMKQNSRYEDIDTRPATAGTLHGHKNKINAGNVGSQFTTFAGKINQKLEQLEVERLPNKPIIQPQSSKNKRPLQQAQATVPIYSQDYYSGQQRSASLRNSARLINLSELFTQKDVDDGIKWRHKDKIYELSTELARQLHSEEVSGSVASTPFLIEAILALFSEESTVFDQTFKLLVDGLQKYLYCYNHAILNQIKGLTTVDLAFNSHTTYREIVEKFVAQEVQRMRKTTSDVKDKDYTIEILKANTALIQKELDQLRSHSKQVLQGEREKCRQQIQAIREDMEQMKCQKEASEQKLNQILNNERYLQSEATLRHFNESLAEKSSAAQNAGTHYMLYNIKLQEELRNLRKSIMEEMRLVHTPRPSMKRLEVLVHTTMPDLNLDIENMPSTTTKLNKIAECLEPRLRYLVEHQRDDESRCKECAKMEKTILNLVSLSVSIRALPGSVMASQITISVKKNKWVELGKTEIIKLNANPKFEQKIQSEYIFEERQELLFVLNDAQNNVLAKVQNLTLGDIMGSFTQGGIQADFENDIGKKYGTLTVQLINSSTPSETVFMKWHAIALRNVEEEEHEQSDPYLTFYQKNANNVLARVHRTEFYLNNLNPQFRRFSIKTSTLCNDNPNLPIAIKCWDWEEEEQCRLIGETIFTLEELKRGKKEFQLKCEEEQVQRAGTLRLMEFSVQRASFLDYLMGGIQLNLMIAIDYTKSNGQASNATSLHYLNEMMPNQYQKSISVIGDLLLKYDADKLVPLYGFGGKPNFKDYKSNKVEHCFNVNGNPKNASVTGIQEIIRLYRESLKNVELSGPTLFDPILQKAKAVAEESKSQGSLNYLVLVILTDGEIYDMEQVIHTITEISRLPVSIIIIGVGNANFQKMQILDGEKCLVSSNGKQAERDIVQFVQYKSFKGDPHMMCKQVIGELPDQLVGYYEMIQMNPPYKK